MGQPEFGLERWAATRALREGEPAVFTRLGLVTGLHPDTIRKRALREGWRSPAKRDSAAGSEAADGPAVAPAEAVGEAMEAGSIEERLARLTGILLRQVEALGLAAQKGGRPPDKARMDAVWSMIRMLEKADAFAREGAGGIQAKRDEEIGDVLSRIDRRIEELARAYAEELVRVELERSGSAADPGRMAAERAA